VPRFNMHVLGLIILLRPWFRRPIGAITTLTGAVPLAARFERIDNLTKS